MFQHSDARTAQSNTFYSVTADSIACGNESSKVGFSGSQHDSVFRNL